MFARKLSLAGILTAVPDDAGNMAPLVEHCYGSQASLDSIHNSWKSSQKKQPEKSENEGFNEDALSRVRKMLLERKVYCALGVMVITAGVFFVRCRRDPHFKRIAVILRYKEKLYAESNNRNKQSRKKKDK